MSQPINILAEQAQVPLWMEALSNGFWVFVGIVAGTVVTLLVVFLLNWFKRKKNKKNINFEISFNISKIQEWKGKLDHVFECSNSDNMDDCLVLFDFTKIILWTVNKSIADGYIYDYLDQESIVTLQKFADFCTSFYSEKLSDTISHFKEEPDKAGVAKMVRFWKQMLDEHEAGLRLILSK